jgi:hypothetical protein
VIDPETMTVDETKTAELREDAGASDSRG